MRAVLWLIGERWGDGGGGGGDNSLLYSLTFAPSFLKDRLTHAERRKKEKKLPQGDGCGSKKKRRRRKRCRH